MARTKRKTEFGDFQTPLGLARACVRYWLNRA